MAVRKIYTFFDLRTMKTELVELGPDMLAAFRENFQKSTRAKMRILVVEDDPMDAAILKACFEPFVQVVKVEFATTSNDAIEQLNSGFDLVLLDLNLGVGSGTKNAHGLDVIKYAKSRMFPVEFIVLTGSFTMDSEEVETASDLGSLWAIKKPIRREQIEAILNRA